jgi:hypothetical protein
MGFLTVIGKFFIRNLELFALYFILLSPSMYNVELDYKFLLAILLLSFCSGISTGHSIQMAKAKYLKKVMIHKGILYYQDEWVKIADHYAGHLHSIPLMAQVFLNDEGKPMVKYSYYDRHGNRKEEETEMDCWNKIEKIMNTNSN